MPAVVNRSDSLIRTKNARDAQNRKNQFDGNDVQAFMAVIENLKPKNTTKIEIVQWSKIKVEFKRLTNKSLNLEELNKIANTENMSRKDIIVKYFSKELQPVDDKCERLAIAYIPGFFPAEDCENKENNVSTTSSDRSSNLPKNILQSGESKSVLQSGEPKSILQSGEPKSVLQSPESKNSPSFEDNKEQMNHEIDFFEREIELRGSTDVPFIELCVQLKKVRDVKSICYEMLLKDVDNSRQRLISLFENKFVIRMENKVDMYLSLKDLNFQKEFGAGDDLEIEKPCSKRHEQEVENDLEAIIAGGDVLVEDYTKFDPIDTSSLPEISQKSDNQVCASKFENGDALEDFICSRLQILMEEGQKSIPIENMHSIINNFFEMHVDPNKEFEKSWSQMANKWVEGKNFYYNDEKTALLLTDPKTPNEYDNSTDQSNESSFATTTETTVDTIIEVQPKTSDVCPSTPVNEPVDDSAIIVDETFIKSLNEETPLITTTHPTENLREVTVAEEPSTVQIDKKKNKKSCCACTIS
uniref:Regulatory protein zeste n=1 Tax=Rhabditophanes sp. KR3021 TaxID=114890 RepID=A0AC35UIL5_9BILA